MTTRRTARTPTARTLPTRLGRQIAGRVALLSLDLLCRRIDTDGQVTALRNAINAGNDPLTRTLALSISRLDPGHPQARQLQTLLNPAPRVLN